MIVDYTNDILVGEPGPNLIFKGECLEFFRLVEIMRSLSVKELEINLTEKIPDWEYLNISKLKFISKKEKSAFSKIEKKEISIQLDGSQWNKISKKTEFLCANKGHVFLEFDDLEFEEGFNTILSSG